MEKEEVTFDGALRKLDDEAMKVIDSDAKKLKNEAKKISHIQQKINEEEQRYMKMVHEFAEEEVIEAKLEEKKLKKAEDIRTRLENVHGSELIGEDVKDMCYSAKNNVKNAQWVDKDTDDRRKELFEKRKAMMAEHDEALKMEKLKIENCHQQLEDEERTYADLQSDIAVELLYRTRIENELEF